MIRVMIVEDSRVIREFLQYLIGRDPRLTVVAAVETAEEALAILHRTSPDVISMDIRLPGMNGFEATQRIMVEKPTPIVVVSASVEAEDLKISMNALRAGALAVVEKPVGTSHSDYELLAERLCTQLAIMSQVKVVRQRFRRKVALPDTGPREAALRPLPMTERPAALRVLGVVASTGGPDALLRVLSELKDDFPIPIFVVQHITASFHQGFVSWLDENCRMPVAVASDAMQAEAGHIYVAPSDHHLLVRRDQMHLARDEPVCAQRPSGTVLFRSLAESYSSRALGVLLTGMGEDGAEGLLALREAGGYTIAEDESTAVVYGMPAAAVRRGAVCECLPLYDIPARIRELITMNR